MTTELKKLNDRQEKFVAAYLSHGNGAQAAREAGYSEKAARGMACSLLKLPQIEAALAAARGAVSLTSEMKAGLNLQKAMIEAEVAMRFAKETENANAYVRAVEHRAKLSGLLVDRHEVKQVGFQVMVSGIDFSKRDGERSGE